jgi:hypothetical protein
MALSRRLIRFTKTTALISFLWTLFCAVLLLGWQVAIWFREGIWHSYTVAALVKADPEVTYTTSSYTAQTTIEKLLEIPAIIPLLIVAALLRAFYGWVAALENDSS